MNLNEFYTELKDPKKRRGCYLAYGNEWKMLEGLLKQSGMYIARYPTVVEAFTDGNIAGKSAIRLVTDDFTVDTEQAEAIKNGVKKDDVLILYYHDLPKNSKIYNRFKDVSVSVEEVNKASQEAFVKRETDCNSKAMIELLVQVCNSYDRLALEVEKINALKAATGLSTTKVIMELEKSGNLQSYEPDTGFEWVEYVMNKQYFDAFESLETIKRYKGYGYGILLLSTLYTTVRNVLLLKQCNARRLDPLKATVLTKGQIYYMKKYVDKYTTQQLVTLLDLIYKANLAYLSGEIDEQFVVESVLIEFWGNV